MGCLNENVEKEYFKNALHFFYEMQWLYNTPVTQILSAKSLEAIPQKWLETLLTLENQELNDFVVNKCSKLEWPECLNSFTNKCKCINRIPVAKADLSLLQLPHNFKKGLSIKKQHEVLQLARLVHKHCTSRGIEVIIDLGAGLGYICQLLHHLYGYRVLGLESDAAKVKNVWQRQKTIYPESLEHVKYVQCKIDENSLELIECALQEEFQENSNVCLIGLHACGDLSIYASKIFTKMKAASLLILIPCCYHKLSLSSTLDTKQYFQNFPVSQCFQNAIRDSNFDIGRFLRQPFLRLACQEPAERWENMSEKTHREHSFHVLARAVLDLYANQNGFSLVKRVQKGTRKSQCANFKSYIKDSLLRYDFQPLEKDNTLAGVTLSHDAHEEEISKLWEEHCHKLNMVEVYTGLQLMLQSPAESLILRDRLCWFWEQNLNAEIVAVMNKTLSPRSHAIISWKT